MINHSLISKSSFITDKSFKEWASMSDKALAEYFGKFVRHHRMEQNNMGEACRSSSLGGRNKLLYKWEVFANDVDIRTNLRDLN